MEHELEDKKPASKRKPSEVKPVEAAPMKPKIVMRGTKQFDHHLLKLLPSTMQKNISWKAQEPMLVPIEHCHIFHSINDTTMQPNKNSTPVGGHFHEVTIEWDGATGDPIFTVSGPLRVVKKQRGHRVFTKVEAVTFERVNPNTGDIDMLADKHTHEIDYLGTETLTQQSRQQYRDDNRQQIQSVSSGPAASNQPAKAQAVQAGAAEGTKYTEKE